MCGAKISGAGTRTRVAWVRATYPNQLDYAGQLLQWNSADQYASGVSVLQCSRHEHWHGLLRSFFGTKTLWPSG